MVSNENGVLAQAFVGHERTDIYPKPLTAKANVPGYMLRLAKDVAPEKSANDESIRLRV